eukprot:TRINITY_DN31199_c0_g1_i1.p1 TRINITY_DN31199_c0_g1~~TRINITY_DN31199_c0_g1_i1.p1  ORF type:complete len:103 (+),score=6.48 TRINITY_DN31199_c0_g1_i1:185-493(+)
MNMHVEIMLVSETFLSMSTMEFSVGSSFERNSLERVWVNVLSGRVTILNGTLSKRTLHPFTLFLGLVTRTWNEGPSGELIARSTYTVLKLLHSSSTSLVDLK